VGAGQVAELVAQMDAREREQRRLKALERRHENDELKALDADLKAVDEKIDLAAHTALLAAGFHLHKRGEWSKRREQDGTPAPSGPTGHDEFLALIDRAQKGDKTALPALRELLKQPAYVAALGGDLAKQAQLTLINKFSGQNLMLKESLTRKLELLRD